MTSCSGALVHGSWSHEQDLHDLKMEKLKNVGERNRNFGIGRCSILHQMMLAHLPIHNCLVCQRLCSGATLSPQPLLASSGP